MTSFTAKPVPLASRGAAARSRRLLRRLHLGAGFLVVGYVYATPARDSFASISLRLLVLPALAVSGLAMWQLPKLRGLVLRRSHRP